MENWRGREIRYLSSRVEDLERQLRRRTLSLVGVLVLGGLLAVTAAAFAVVVPLYGPPEPPPAAREAAPVPEPPTGLPWAAEAEQTDQALAAVRSGGSGVSKRQEEAAGREAATAGRTDERVTTSRETSGAALGAALTAARERIAELEAAGARHEVTIAGLRTELEGTRAEARALGEQIEAGRRGIEGLNAILAATMAGGGRRAGEEGLQAGPRDAGGAEPASAPAEATVRASPWAEEGGDAVQAGGAPSYAAIHPVNLRAAPSNAAEVLAVVEQGDVVQGIGQQGGWLQVEYDGRLGRDVTGWVHNGHLRRVGAPPEGNGPPARTGD